MNVTPQRSADPTPGRTMLRELRATAVLGKYDYAIKTLKCTALAQMASRDQRGYIQHDDVEASMVLRVLAESVPEEKRESLIEAILKSDVLPVLPAKAAASVLLTLSHYTAPRIAAHHAACATNTRTFRRMAEQSPAEAFAVMDEHVRHMDTADYQNYQKNLNHLWLTGESQVLIIPRIGGSKHSLGALFAGEAMTVHLATSQADEPHKLVDYQFRKDTGHLIPLSRTALPAELDTLQQARKIPSRSADLERLRTFLTKAGLTL